MRVCTFNLRHSFDDVDTINAWKNRRNIVKRCLELIDATIIGTQEGNPVQLNEVLDDLNDKSSMWSLIGDELDELHTVNGIFYRNDLLKVCSNSTFWFNEEPSKAVAAWGAKYPRGCNRVEFEEIESQRRFFIYNVHLDFPSDEARRNSIPVLVNHIKLFGDDLNRIIVTGDFNNWPERIEGETPIDLLIELGEKAPEIERMKAAGFVDTYQHGQTPTFNGFKKYGYGPKIDFVWISKHSVFTVAGETKVEHFSDENGCFPSDHFPVFADLKFSQ